MTKTVPGLAIYDYENFELKTLVVDSEALKRNPLGDPSRRTCPVMVPRAKGSHPVVFMLSGFTGNGTQAFNVKSFEEPGSLKLDKAVSEGRAPHALYVYVDAFTLWGGSQFIDSKGMGAYEQFVAQDLATAVRANFETTNDWCVMGGSSGGYGALHLASRHPSLFGTCIALAPDSFFEASLLPEIRTALPIITRMGGVRAVREELANGKLMKRKDWHVILNAVAMGLCYGPLENSEPLWPIDRDSGLVREDVWTEWMKHDPLVFLRERDVSRVDFYLDAGDRDQFQLQYGTRQIRDLLKSKRASVEYVGFEGTHFDLGERRGPAWAWLAGHWRV